MRGKKGFEFSFAVIFALIVGAAILFLAIYAAVKLVESSTFSEQTAAAKELSVIFNPLETGLASGKSTLVNLNANTRIYNFCSESGSFGNEKFSISQMSGFAKKWPLPGAGITVYNKYIFSDNVTEGKTVYFFSKPFQSPFKVSEIIFMTTKKYCFVDAPEFVKDEVSQLGLPNVKIENCSSSETKICFNSAGCDIVVYPGCSGICDSDLGEYEFGEVRKNGVTLYYTDSLIYGAIFSSPEVYDCNFKRLMLRIEQISALYKDEAEFISGRGCGNNLGTNLQQLSEAAKSADSRSSSSILNLRESANAVDMQNSATEGCNIY